MGRLAPWSQYALSQGRNRRIWAEGDAKDLVDVFRMSGDWRAFIVSACDRLIMRYGKEHKYSYPPALFAEALSRELETVSLEEIVMKNMTRSN